ncbi:lipase 1-like [Toxorhynchites rutilus septentrionalis]|uniref:lipase 1-like n=1 Tax=Toxorhynchites rutilus septentrionalis TaxID=329112 RepID=UPI00247AFD5E|nr:lipase 1-like [Toxorhynchites rutilus septentrionalis]
MHYLSVIICILLLPTAPGRKDSSPFIVEEEDGVLLVPQLIRKYGYQMEEHEVRTEDGYLLSVYRILGRGDTRKSPILMMHSLFSSCADWVAIGPKNALGYLLADRGYDIWLGNARGNRYGRKHESLTVDIPGFWNFTFHEIAVYDVTATIDYVLEQTNAEKLHYIGFSQGTLVGFVALSSRPEYNEKIIEVQQLSPAVYINRNLSVIIRLLVFFVREIALAYNAIGKNDFLSHFDGQYEFFRKICPAPDQTICRAVVYDVAGANPQQLGVKIARIFLGHFPAGSSLKQVMHIAQLIRDGIFRQYDYGNSAQNIAAYGSPSPPLYDLSRVTAPVRIYYGYNDNVVNYRNIPRLERDLPNLLSSYPVPDKLFSHVDFILAKNVRKVLYKEIIKNVERAERDYTFEP